MRFTIGTIAGLLFLCGAAVQAQPPGTPPSPEQAAETGPLRSGDFKVYDIKGIPTSHEVTLKTRFNDQPLAATLFQLAALAQPVWVDDPTEQPVAPSPGAADANAIDGAVTSAPNSGEVEVDDGCTNLTWYRLEQAEPEPPRYVEVENRFGVQRLTLRKPRFLLAPARPCGFAAASATEGNSQLDHFKGYEVTDCRPVNRVVSLLDPSGICESHVPVLKPRYVALPVEKTHDGNVTEITDPDRCLAFYEIQSTSEPLVTVGIEDQFAQCDVCLRKAVLLGTPSRVTLIDTATDLDNFQVYDARDVPVEEVVKLQGPFEQDARQALAHLMTSAATPVGIDGADVIDTRAHFTWYAINDSSLDPVRTVTIWNRFGEQRLNLGRAAVMLVPAGVDGAAAPADLDHYKGYLVLNSSDFRPEFVDLEDAFKVSEQTEVRGPALFCVPVTKTHGDAQSGPIQRVRDHLTFYGTDGGLVTDRSLGLRDQFGAYETELTKRIMLGVPTMRLDVFPPIPPARVNEAADELQASRQPARARGLSSAVGLFQKLLGEGF